MLLVLVVAAQLADVVTFLIAVPLVGIGDELNPIARLAYDAWGSTGDVALKLLGVVPVIAILLVYRGSERRRRLLASFVALAGLFGAFSNVLALIRR